MPTEILLQVGGFFVRKSYQMNSFHCNGGIGSKQKTCGFEVQPKFFVFVPVLTAPSGGRHAQLNTTHSLNGTFVFQACLLSETREIAMHFSSY